MTTLAKAFEVAILAQIFEVAILAPRNRYGKAKSIIDWNYVNADCFNTMHYTDIGITDSYYEEFDALVAAYEKKVVA